MSIIVIGGGITGLLVARQFSDSIVVESKIKNRNSYASLWNIFPPLCGNRYKDCIEAENEYLFLCKKFGILCKKTHILRKAQNKIGGKIIYRNEIKGLEPYVNLDEAEYFDNGFFIEGEDLIKNLTNEVNVIKGKALKFNISSDYIEGVVLDNNQVLKGDFYIVTASYLLNDLIGNFIKLQPFKGHLIISPSRANLNGILIINDRIAVEGNRLYMNGDSTNDSSPEINYEQVLKTISTFKEVLNFDIREIEIRVGFRSVSSSGEPVLVKPYKNLILVGGYRFGFAIAPNLSKKVKELISKG